MKLPFKNSPISQMKIIEKNVNHSKMLIVDNSKQVIPNGLYSY